MCLGQNVVKQTRQPLGTEWRKPGSEFLVLGTLDDLVLELGRGGGIVRMTGRALVGHPYLPIFAGQTITTNRREVNRGYSSLDSNKGGNSIYCSVDLPPPQIVPNEHCNAPLLLLLSWDGQPQLIQLII